MKQTIHTILAQFREEDSSNRNLGERFLGPYPDVMPS